ncbi:hypothetical protein Tco_1476897 [Tanacetum coccineum]
MKYERYNTTDPENLKLTVVAVRQIIGYWRPSGLIHSNFLSCGFGRPPHKNIPVHQTSASAFHQLQKLDKLAVQVLEYRTLAGYSTKSEKSNEESVRFIKRLSRVLFVPDCLTKVDIFMKA